MASSAYKNKTGLPFLFSFCLKFFNKLSENVGEAADGARRRRIRSFSPRRRRWCSPVTAAQVKIWKRKERKDQLLVCLLGSLTEESFSTAGTEKGKVNPNFCFKGGVASFLSHYTDAVSWSWNIEISHLASALELLPDPTVLTLDPD